MQKCKSVWALIGCFSSSFSQSHLRHFQSVLTSIRSIYIYCVIQYVKKSVCLCDDRRHQQYECKWYIPLADLSFQTLDDSDSIPHVQTLPEHEIEEMKIKISAIKNEIQKEKVGSHLYCFLLSLISSSLQEWFCEALLFQSLFCIKDKLHLHVLFTDVCCFIKLLLSTSRGDERHLYLKLKGLFIIISDR